MSSLYQKTLDRLRQYAQSKGSISALADSLEAKRSVFHKALKGKQTYAKTYLDWLEKAGAQIVFPEDNLFAATRPIQIFYTSTTSDGASRPPGDNYLAVPLVDRSNMAKRNSNVEPQDWIIIRAKDDFKDQANLVVLQIDIEENSMSPLLYPGDFVLVDCNCNLPQEPPGNVYLAQTPDREGALVKRVQIHKKNDKSNVIFYSDNPVYGPETYDLNSDFDGDIRKAIIGKVVWSWNQISKR